MTFLEALQGNEDAIAHANDIIKSYNKRIAMQRRVMSDKTTITDPNEKARDIAMVTGELMPDIDWTTVDIVVPLPHHKVRIGTAQVRYKDGVPEIGEMKIAGKGAPLLGINLSLMSFEPGNNPAETPDALLFATNVMTETTDEDAIVEGCTDGEG